MFDILRSEKVIFSWSGRNLPCQKWIDQKWATMREVKCRDDVMRFNRRLHFTTHKNKIMTTKLKPEDIINVGFGWCYLLKDGKEIWRQDDYAIWGYDGDGETPWDRCQDIEAIAQKDLSARYLLVRYRAVTAQIFERFETGWIEIRNMLGFADDNSAEAFEEELAKVKTSKTLTFLD